jgi:cell division protein FtsN
VDLVNRLKEKGYSASIVNSGGKFKVFVGSYGARDKADDASKKLQGDGFDAFVVNE